MPSKRTRRTRQRRAEVPAAVIALLNASESENAVRFFMPDAELRAAWNRVRDGILAEWIEERPGSRPLHWWRFSALERRRRLGGTGQPAHDVSGYAEEYEFGLPTIWVQQGGFLAGIAVDPSDPPTFESEAAYLRRLGLLQAGESERLSKADYEPEAIKGESED